MQRILAGFIMAVALGVAVPPAQAVITYERIVEDDGYKLLLLKGEFEANDDVSKLETEVLAFEPDAIMFDSPGGIITTALEFGRKIRELEVNTVQVRAHLCASACAFAFAGGYERSAEAGSIGVHQSWFPDDVNTSEAVAGIQQVTAEVMAYLAEMDVDVSLLQISMSTASEDMRYLTVQEMSDLWLITPEDEAADTQDAAAEPSDAPQTQADTQEAPEDKLPRRRKVPAPSGG